MGSMNSNFKVEVNADIIFESEISDISTKLKKKNQHNKQSSK